MADSEIPRNLLPLEQTPTGELVHAMRVRVKPFNGVELEVEPREPMREPVNLDN